MAAREATRQVHRRRMDLSNQQMYAVLHADSKAKGFQRLRPGQQIRFLLGDDKRLEEMVYQRSLTDVLRVVQEGDKLRVESQNCEFETRTRYARARIENSLFEAGRQTGLSDSITMQAAEIFAWDIDFALDIRRGDRFRVLYEEKYLDGAKVKDGAVLAVEFSNKGKTYRAIRYTDPKGRSGYYAPDGRSLRKGQWVKQGQVIGYVGSSGLASGPHLHYEFRVGGKHRNPLTVKLPAAEPIPKAYLADFKAHSRGVLRDLDEPEPTTVALNQVE